MTKNKLDKYGIIEILAKEKKVEKFIQNTAKTSAPELDDLAQDIYLILLDMEEEKLIQLYDNKQLDYWIARIILNQYFSSTSTFFTKYKKFQHLSEQINKDIKNRAEKTEWMQEKSRKEYLD